MLYLGLHLEHLIVFFKFGQSLISMKTKYLPLLLFSCIVLSLAIIAPSCGEVEERLPQNPNSTPSGNADEEIESVTEDGGYVCTFVNPAEELLHLKFDNGDVYVCTKVDSKVTQIDLPAGSTVKCSYNSEGLISEFEHDYGGYKIVNRCSYSDGNISEIEGLTSFKQQDDTYEEETNFKCSNIVADNDGIKSCVYETYVSGSIFQSLDLTFTCSTKSNSLYQSATQCTLNEFTDYFNNFFYYSPKCIETILVEEQGSSNSFSVNYECKWNSNNQITELNIDHPAKQVKRTYTYID